MERTLDPLMAEAGLQRKASPSRSAASWGAIIAGALVAIAVSLILFALGSGLGFASISPWADRGVGATTFTIGAAIWLIVMQWVSALLGGYIAGRLRTRWLGTHVHEVFFRDTAHGFVTWALATVVVATVLASSVSSGVSGGVHAASNVASGAAQGAMSGAEGTIAQRGMSGAPPSTMTYEVDKLFRSGSGSTSSAAGMGDQRGSDPRMEAARIMVNALSTGSVPDSDRAYLVGVVAARTGLSEADAQRRADDFISSAMEAEARVKAAADAARKAAAELGIYTALSMLMGAFIASVAAVLGGRVRDEHL
jgi:hypothetical protein